jgi:hypothetical protein
MADIFVSYTSSDRDWAFWVGHELQALGHTPRIHEWEISAGGDIAAWMDARHDAADHILCIVSSSYLAKPYSAWERRAAQWAAVTDRPNFAVPVFVEPCEAPTLFAHLKRCDLYGLSEEDARARLKTFLEPAAIPPRGIFPRGAKAFSEMASAPRSFPGKAALSNVPIAVPPSPVRRSPGQGLRGGGTSVQEIAPPRVFISYSHDSDQHKERVLALADRLRSEGIDARIDRYLEAPAVGWPAWCAREIRKADFVLMVCTEIYRRRVDLEDEPGRGHGVLWEARLIHQELYDAGSVSTKFVPVLLEDGSPEHVPAPVRGMTIYKVETDDGFESLCRLLLKQPATPPPPIGARKVRLPQARPAGRRGIKAEKPAIEAQPYEGTGAEPAAAARSALGSIPAADHAVAPRVELNSGASESAEPFSLVWNVPYARNLQFTGRSEVIVRLETELNSGPAAAVTQAIAGLGGIGKTQLALEYCYRNREKYKVIWWIRAESKETRITDFVALGQRIGVIDIDSSDDSASIRPIIEWLDRNSRWLLVFDNVEAPSDLDGLLPTAGRGHILITSRHAAWGSRANAVALDVWTADEASRYLLKRTGQADSEVNRASATALADALGYLPLAIEQAAAYIDETKIGIVGYAELFEKQQLRLLRSRPSYRNSDAKTISTVWEISLLSVEQKSPGAVALLKLCAFMRRPDQISKRGYQKSLSNYA